MQVYGISCTGISILGSSAGGSYRTSEHYFGPTCRTPWSCWQSSLLPPCRARFRMRPVGPLRRWREMLLQWQWDHAPSHREVVEEQGSGAGDV